MSILTTRIGGATDTISTGSNLAIVPAPTLPAYSASKAALNAFVLCLRDQLRDTSVKVIELSPPPVQSTYTVSHVSDKLLINQAELHDYMGDARGRGLGMPIDDFINAAYHGLASGSDQIIIGSVGPAEPFNDIVDKRRAAFQNLAKMMRGAH